MKISQITNIHLGSGLIGIGRKWGHVQTAIPTEQEVMEFLRFATNNHIIYFDTAPAYGTSEERLGKFLSKLSLKKRATLIIATKFGEHWNHQASEGYVDHSYEALKNSLDQSIKLLKQIDLLYLHKAHLQALQSNEVAKAFAYAKSQGITEFGASVSDLEAANFVVNSNFYSVIQLPYNISTTTFSDIIDIATNKGKKVVINRPFNMGKDAADKIAAFEFILQKKFNGFILTGTKSSKHLTENYDAFIKAKTYNPY